MAYFKYVETIPASEHVLNTIRDEVTGFNEYPYNPDAGETPIENKWEVVKEEVDEDGRVGILELKSTMSIQGEEDEEPLTKDFYVRFTHRGLVPDEKVSYSQHSTIEIQVLDGPKEGGGYKLEGHPVLFQYADEQYKPTDRNLTKPVYMYLCISNNKLAIVATADPAVNFNDYRKSFLYVGALKPYKYNTYDVEGNVALTAGAVVDEPTSADIAKGDYYFGEYTSAGNNTIQMLKTKSGIEFQKHYPAFITQAPPPGKAYIDPSLGDTGLELERQGFQASKWTSKYHLSPLHVVHPYEGYRGTMDSVIAVTKHNILHLDELIVDVEGKPWKQEVYRYFDINTEQNLMNLSANQHMGVAILKEVRY